MPKRSAAEKLGRLARAIYLKLFRINDSPAKIALGFGLGAFIGVMPGVGPPVAFGLSFLFRVNRASALLGSVLFNTWIGFLSLFLAVRIGAALTGTRYGELAAGWGEWVKGFRWEKWSEAPILDILAPIALGYLVIAAAIASAAAGLVYAAALRFRKKKNIKGGGRR